MQKTFTPNEAVETTMPTMQAQARPRRSTVEFIKQFARAYSFRTIVPMGLGEFVAN